MLNTPAGLQALPFAHDTGAISVWSWTFDPPVWAGLGLAAALYSWGLWRWRKRNVEYSLWHPIAFYSALLLALVALQSPLERLADELLTGHMVQHMLLVMWVAPLLVLGAPATPVLRGLPAALRLGAVRPLARARWSRRLFPLLVRPVPAWLLMTTALWAWHLPAAYELAAQNHAWHAVEHASLVLGAAFFWSALIDIKPLRSRLSYPGRMAYLLAAAAQGTALSLVILLSRPGLYPSYTGALGFSAAQDQQSAAFVMMIPGDMMYLAGAIVCLFVWLEKEEQRAEQAQSAAAGESDAISPGH